jgi:NADPH-dependent glutamate synthase beta subunit-like oxidoreductase/NAD(P)H-flavin reductase
MTVANPASPSPTLPPNSRIASEAKSGIQNDFSDWVAATSDPGELNLGIAGFCYEDLYTAAGLSRLTTTFHEYLKSKDAEAWKQFDSLIAHHGQLATPIATSNALLAAAPYLSAFLVQLFGIEQAADLLKSTIDKDQVVWKFKQDFVKKRVFKTKVTDDHQLLSRYRLVADCSLVVLGVEPSCLGTGTESEERALAECTVQLLEIEDTARKVQKGGGAAWKPELQTITESLLLAWEQDESVAQITHDLRQIVAEIKEPSVRAEKVASFVLEAICLVVAFRRKDHHDPAHLWSSLHEPKKIAHEQLVEIRRPKKDFQELFVGPEGHRRDRAGFELTDDRSTRRKVQDQVEYCLYCHDRNKDSCSKGLLDAKTGVVKSNPLGVELPGCPLNEKISEMHLMRKQGDTIAALALVCIDNPLCPGTGHRICNDCMKACIFQKQEPVNIPHIETQVLTDVLELPWGFELYGLLTRWNPLNVKLPHPKPLLGKSVLVVGLGPAGYTLAHHLTRAGFAVAGVDGLRIEPLPIELTGTESKQPRPIRDFAQLCHRLDERILLGFGGVSEYGITSRWDKNFLSAVYITLARNRRVRIYGGIRFGGTITLDDAWKMGFDHVALAAGAGSPTIIPMKNNLARGIRKASDFLMALQLTGAYKHSSLANLQVQLPAIVIGGGLTAIDTATELLAYYIVQAEKTSLRYRTLLAEKGEAELANMFDEGEHAFLKQQCEHADAIAAERQQAAAEGRTPNLQALLQSWGGVSIVYRKRVLDSPAYRLNHEEVEKSLEEGVQYIENLSPVEAVLDETSAVKAVKFERQVLVDGKWSKGEGHIELPCKTLCVAAGTAPNVTYEKEYPGVFQLDGRKKFFAAHDAHRNEKGDLELSPTSSNEHAFFTSYLKDGKTVSFYGDNHPFYAGSVVKAMASAKVGFEYVCQAYEIPPPKTEQEALARRQKIVNQFQQLDDQLLAKVHKVTRLTHNIVEVVVRAPAAARKFEPGQFYRLQNFESLSPIIDGNRLAMEGLAMTGAWVDKEQGLISTIVLEMGVSSRLCATLKEGEPVVLMGPTGTPTEIPAKQTVLLCGGGLGNAVLFSIAKAMKDKGDTVIYFAGYKDGADLFRQGDIEVSTDQVIWCTDMGNEIEPRRPQDFKFRGNIVQAMVAYAEGKLGKQVVELKTVRRVIAIGSDRMMNAVREARHTSLEPYLDPKHIGIGSINSPMQCMMKEICAQCLQKHRDPVTGKEFVVFSCSNQDQELDKVDFQHLNQRLRANSAQEKLSNMWLSHLLVKQPDLIRT